MERYFTLLFTFPKRPRFTSRIISWILGTKYSHVCGVVGTGPIGLFDLYEASHGNVHDIDLENFLSKNKVIKTCRIKLEDKEDLYKIIRYMKKQRGKDYSEWGAIASTVGLFRAIGLGKDGDSEFICSEYMVRALEQAELFTEEDYKEGRGSSDYVDPKFFEKMLVDAGFSIYEGLHLPEFKGADEAI